MEADKTVLANDREATIATVRERLSTADALLTCWRHGLPLYAGGVDERDLAGTKAGTPQVAMRGICALLELAEHDFDCVRAPDKPALALMYANGMADTIESVLWQQTAGDSEQPLAVVKLDRSAAYVQSLITQVEQWLHALQASEACAKHERPADGTGLLSSTLMHEIAGLNPVRHRRVENCNRGHLGLEPLPQLHAAGLRVVARSSLGEPGSESRRPTLAT